MDNEEAKFILGSYRPNGADANDPAMAEALRQAALDPALAREFAGQQAFDERLARSLQPLRGPDAGKATIMAMRHAAGRPARSWWPLGLGFAAALAVAAMIGVSRPQGGMLELSATASLAALATELSAHHLSLDQRSADVGVLTAWLRDHEAPLPAKIPSGLARLPAIGCQKWNTSRGKVALICFRSDGGEVLHLYVFADPAAAATTPELAAAQVQTSGRWSLAQWREGDCVCVLGVPAGAVESPAAVREYLHI